MTKKNNEFTKISFINGVENLNQHNWKKIVLNRDVTRKEAFFFRGKKKHYCFINILKWYNLGQKYFNIITYNLRRKSILSILEH